MHRFLSLLGRVAVALVFCASMLELGACTSGSSCEDADALAAEISRSAIADGITTNGICVKTDEELRAELEAAGRVPVDVIPRRIDYYGDACTRHKALLAECEGG
jgi:hypothetical protein